MVSVAESIAQGAYPAHDGNVGSFAGFPSSRWENVVGICKVGVGRVGRVGRVSHVTHLVSFVCCVSHNLSISPLVYNVKRF